MAAWGYEFYCLVLKGTASGNVASMREPLDGSLWWYWIAAVSYTHLTLPTIYSV